MSQKRTDKTRACILKAAQTLFSKHGFAGTSIGAIAAKAKVTKSLIFHHFTNKASLWLAVKENILAKSNEQPTMLPSTTLPFDKFMVALVRQGIAFYHNHPQIVRLIGWQRMEHGKAKTPGLALSKEVKAWISAFKHYQQTGEINPKLAPEFIFSMVIAIISSAALDKNTFTNSKVKMDNYISFCAKRLLQALK